MESLVHVMDLLVHKHLALDPLLKLSKFVSFRPIPIKQNVTHLNIIALLHQLRKRIASVKYLSIFPCHGDRRHAAACERVAWVVAENAGLGVERLDVDELQSIFPFQNW